MSFITGGGASGAVVHPGYVVNSWYTMPPTSPVANGGAMNVGQVYCTPVFFPLTFKIAAIGARVQTLGTSNIQLALYQNNSGATPAVNRAGLLIARTGDIADTSAAFVSGVVQGGAVTVAGGWYWAALQVNDTTVRMDTRSPADLSVGVFQGSPTGGNVVGPTNNVTGGTYTGTTYGTWPADLTVLSFIEISGGTAPILAFQAGA